MSAWLGFRQVNHPFSVRDRENGTSKWSYASLAGLALQAIAAYSAIPLRLISGCGFAFVGFAAIFGLVALVQYFSGQAVTGFTTVIVLLSATAGMMMVGMGIIGEYIARIYEEVKGRPRYIVSETRFPNRDWQQIERMRTAQEAHVAE